ncbi:uncharacterized protein [Physcomitrium patens]|uniref:C2H2-type domain-containing protein n=1 Tax=Physcomitrium patens TaxID=3218 RepID=A0A2K1KNZ4_PHYPA|nr:uncharacterized protein LOC112281445 [Physcomitrium patens]XP_024373733.1 uncharacterized protein LOC112281445 [Physcomitrium patens]XP_024373734.1 uncharacterized protein LOC112281445 [Physcomitrium patens]XP_024373735.1 uncharacterized protein LOC112281445 [Physcomitrium patens]XP_024373736.1 uncharacterized protein LOC112281445 [Physcomitrium patens]XP_024373737.1 uncharacterized protein LOC112281445 [Physcomitrium patens]PNR55481.1 hypothetical protein PHYPA_006378 [Physcomitrium paten|eukprot:XP_024373732.1 uncharacterized protein LOC112281445 [Physcomitrella patens]
MQGASQQQSSSPSNDSLLTFAFLGQHLRQFSNTVPLHPHQNQLLQSLPLDFALGVNAQEQAQAHQNHRSHSQLVPIGGSGGGGIRSGDRMGEMLQHLQHGNMASNFDQLQFSSQLMNSNFSENLSCQSTVDQNVQTIMEHLSMLQERISQLQALVPLISHTAHSQIEGNTVAQQQAASAAVVSIISQLAMVAIGLLPQSFENSGGQGNQSAELPLSQLLQASVGQQSNFFQQDTVGEPLRAPQRCSSLGTSMGNNFGTPAEVVSGVGAGVNSSVLSDNCGLRFPSGGTSFPGLNSDGDLTGPQNLSGQPSAGRGSSGTLLQNQICSGGGKDLGSVAGGGKRRRVANKDSNLLDNSLAAGTNTFISNELGGVSGGLENLDTESRSDDDSDGDGDGENIIPGSFDLVEMNASEILAEHTHFCEICGKGFKRDANLRMHMRGHGDEYKTPAALARPDKDYPDTSATRLRRYSCPCVGCKRNKEHRKFQPLKTMLCVKNHYRRSHCPKVLTCQKCMTKKFSVVADLKTHEKHCGRERWQCSCGTTFSRKDKLFGHINLFAGHTPVVVVMQESEAGGGGGGNSAQDNQGSPNSGSFGSENNASRRFFD